MTSQEARETALAHAVQLQLAATSIGMVHDVVAKANEFAEFLDPSPAGRLATMVKVDTEEVADAMSRRQNWRAGPLGVKPRYNTWTNAWPIGAPHIYEVRLEAMSDPTATHVLAKMLAPCIADAIHQAEEDHPGYIARQVHDVS